jgi:hypothetical protein
MPRYIFGSIPERHGEKEQPDILTSGVLLFTE